MIDYKPEKPLIVIHVPKSGGISTRVFFEKWFGKSLYLHYYNEHRAKMPDLLDLSTLASSNNSIAVYGHFNMNRGFGIKDYYPEVSQFVTVLRDPFELACSSFFYIRKQGMNWLDQSIIPKDDIVEHIVNTKPNMLNHFPIKVTKENYKELIEKYFIEIGITEQLEKSLERVAVKLGVEFDSSLLECRNATERNQQVPDYMREVFVDKNPLEYEVYEYIVRKFNEKDTLLDSKE